MFKAKSDSFKPRAVKSACKQANKRSLLAAAGAIAITSSLALNTTSLASDEARSNDKLPFVAGMWEMKTRVEHPIAGNNEMVGTECLSEDLLSGEKMSSELEKALPNGQCEVETKVDGEDVEMNISCSGDGATIEGKGKFKVTDQGKTLSGAMTMIWNMQGNSLEMKSESSGKYVGSC